MNKRSKAGKSAIEPYEKLLGTLKARFEKNAHRHPGIAWSDVLARLEAKGAKLRSLQAMESTGGEPDVVGHDAKTGEYVFFDCSAETPAERRSLCYDREAWEFRKEHKPEGSAMELAEEMGIELLTEEQYFELQKLGDFDTKTSSWIKTPPEFRDQGGALFADRRYGRVFVYQNSAPCYYRVRGFRGSLKL